VGMLLSLNAVKQSSRKKSPQSEGAK
jgi:hypothetical protein